MSAGVSFHFENDIVWLGLSNVGPSVVSAQFAENLSKALNQAGETTGARCVVLSGAPKGFPRGPSFAEMPEQGDMDIIAKTLMQIETFPVPVVAVIPDAAINEGLELALAAHYRVALGAARFGINHIATGAMPGLGGTQRLPRLTGAKVALEILLNGNLYTAQKALQAGLIDLVVKADFAAETNAFVKSLLDNNRGPRPTGRMVSGQADPVHYQAQMAEARKLVQSFGVPAAQAIVDCVEAAQITPLETGLRIERSKYEECLHSPEAISLRHVAQAERRLSRPGRRGAGYVKVCVLAAKPEDAGLCVALLDSGLDVVVVDHVPPPHPGMAGAIMGIYDTAVLNGRMSPKVRSGRVARLETVARDQHEVSADVYIDAGRFPQGEVLDWLAPRIANDQQTHVVLTARTAPEALDLANALPGHVNCAAYYFERPAHVAKIVEVLPIPGQPDQAIEDIQEFFRITRRMPVLIEGMKEPVSALIRRRLFEATEALLLHGAEPKAIDAALGRYGFRQGPLAMRDAVGLELDLVPGRQPATQAMIDNGRTGRDAGLGYFRYAKDDPRPRPDSVIVWILASARDRQGVTPREFSESQIVTLVVGALINLGAELLENEVVQRASDIDVLAIHSIGFPRRRGGPMQAAEQFGLLNVMQIMGECAPLAPDIWQVHPLIADLVKYGQGFENMDLPELDSVQVN